MGSNSTSETYSNKYISFVISKNSIGKGGNGEVFDVRVKSCESIIPNVPLVVKFFTVKKDKEKRYERFKNEVETVIALQDKIDGIMKIFTCELPDKCSGNRDAWYIMPKAEIFKVNSKKSPLEILTDLCLIGETIQKIHELKYSHRDIKPENILIVDTKPCLSDFGLVWQESDEKRITQKKERIGPYKILPPELEEVDLLKKIDFKKSDVYLFAKVVWMCIKKDNFGFRGHYNRSTKSIYLEPKKHNCYTLEPIHLMLEESTYDDFHRRITIDKCLEYIYTQIAICKEEIDPKKLNEYRYSELKQSFINNEKPDEHVYKTINAPILNKFVEMYKMSEMILYIIDGLATKVSANNIKIKENNFLEFINFSSGTVLKKYLIKVKHIIIPSTDKIITVICDNMLENEYEGYTKFTEFQANSFKTYKNIAFNESIAIKIEVV